MSTFIDAQMTIMWGMKRAAAKFSTRLAAALVLMPVVVIAGSIIVSRFSTLPLTVIYLVGNCVLPYIAVVSSLLIVKRTQSHVEFCRGCGYQAAPKYIEGAACPECGQSYALGRGLRKGKLAFRTWPIVIVFASTLLSALFFYFQTYLISHIYPSDWLISETLSAETELDFTQALRQRQLARSSIDRMIGFVLSHHPVEHDSKVGNIWWVLYEQKLSKSDIETLADHVLDYRFDSDARSERINPWMHQMMVDTKLPLSVMKRYWRNLNYVYTNTEVRDDGILVWLKCQSRTNGTVPTYHHAFHAGLYGATVKTPSGEAYFIPIDYDNLEFQFTSNVFVSDTIYSTKLRLQESGRHTLIFYYIIFGTHTGTDIDYDAVRIALHQGDPLPSGILWSRYGQHSTVLDVGSE